MPQNKYTCHSTHVCPTANRPYMTSYTSKTLQNGTFIYHVIAIFVPATSVPLRSQIPKILFSKTIIPTQSINYPTSVLSRPPHPLKVKVVKVHPSSPSGNTFKNIKSFQSGNSWKILCERIHDRCTISTMS